MEITRAVVKDLLPLYLADEVSADTRALVEQFLQTDPELAALAKAWASAESMAEIPVPLSKEAEMETYKEVRRWMVVRTLGLAMVIAVVFICTLGMVLGGAIFYWR